MEVDTVQRVCEAIARQEDAPIISQQRGEPDPTLEEKVAVLRPKLQSNPGAFLQKWGSRLPHDVLQCFEPLREQDDIVSLCLDKLRADRNQSTTIVRNRRYKRMHQLMDEGQFFSEEAMKERCPWLYDQFVGRYLSDAEVEQRVSEITQTWSDQLLAHAASKRTSDRLEYEKQMALATWEEEEDDDEENTAQAAIASVVEQQEAVEAMATCHVPGLPEAAQMRSTVQSSGTALEFQLLGDESDETRAKERADITNEERERLRHEFARMMQERFLRGEDAEFFDYSAVDENPALDDLEKKCAYMMGYGSLLEAENDRRERKAGSTVD